MWRSALGYSPFSAVQYHDPSLVNGGSETNFRLWSKNIVK